MYTTTYAFNLRFILTDTINILLAKLTNVNNAQAFMMYQLLCVLMDQTIIPVPLFNKYMSCISYICILH